MSSRSKLKTVLVLFVFVRSVCGLRVKSDEARMDMLDMSSGKRTFLVGKILLIPTLAALGAKFLAILPLFLAKIILLGVMNFVATNLNLIIALIVNFKNLFKQKSYAWPTEEEILLPAQFNYQSALNPNFKYDYFFNRRSNKPEKGKVLKAVNDDFGNSKQDKLKSYMNPYLNTLTRSGQSIDGNNDHLFYRQHHAALSSGKYKCYWTDSYNTAVPLLTKKFQPSFYSRNDYDVKDYNIKDINGNNFHVNDYNAKDFDIKDNNINNYGTSEEPIPDVKVLEPEAGSNNFDINKYELLDNARRLT